MRRADRVLLHEFGHIDPDHRLFTVEEKIGQRTGKFGFADTGGTKKDKRAQWSVRVLQACSCSAHRVGNGGDSLFLANDSFFQNTFGM